MRMADGRWQMADGRWQMAFLFRHPPSAIRHPPSVLSHITKQGLYGPAVDHFVSGIQTDDQRQGDELVLVVRVWPVVVVVRDIKRSRSIARRRTAAFLSRCATSRRMDPAPRRFAHTASPNAENRSNRRSRSRSHHDAWMMVLSC